MTEERDAEMLRLTEECDRWREAYEDVKASFRDYRISELIRYLLTIGDVENARLAALGFSHHKERTNA